jgi:tetratricopeptide (TPR) repeat protein
MDAKETTQQIKALRDEDKLEDALHLARPLYSTYPKDIWVVRALGWTLYKYIKQEKTAGNLNKAIELATELKNMGVTVETDELLFTKSEFILKTLSPEYSELEKAKVLSKEGKHAAATDILRKTVKTYPDCAEAKTSLAWELYRLLKEETDLTHSIDRMRDYCRLKLNTKPELIHSLFLSEACKRAEKWSDFSKFVEWWNTDNLSDEDWKEAFGKDGSGPFPSLAAKLAKALYKNAKLFHKRGPSFKWMLPFVRKVVETIDGDWLPYYYAKLSVWFDAEMTGVKDLVIPLLKAKQREFWAWQTLAECTLDNSEIMAFYARAVVSPAPDEDFKVELYHQFALFLVTTKQFALASLSARRYIAIQDKKGRKVEDDIIELQRSSWFDANAKDNLDDMLQSAADEATRFLFKDHPWTPANFLEVLDSKDGRPPLALFLVPAKGCIKVKNRCVQSEKPERGAAIRVKLFSPPASTKPPKPGEPPHGPPLPEFYELETRQDGFTFDCANSCLAVISQVSLEKKFARVSLTPKSFGLLHFESFSDATQLILGDVVRVYISDQDLKAQEFVPIFSFRKDARQAIIGFYREFSGRISIGEGNSFGFVSGINDIFVSPAIVARYHLADSKRISGWALHEWNSNKGKTSWSALTIDLEKASL